MTLLGLRLAMTTCLLTSIAGCATLRPPEPPPIVLTTPPHPAEIPPPECQLDPATPAPFSPTPLPPLRPETDKTAAAADYWQARARRAELAALNVIGYADELKTTTEGERERIARCALWARDLKEREERRVKAGETKGQTQ
jgi:hypothetical protein